MCIYMKDILYVYPTKTHTTLFMYLQSRRAGAGEIITDVLNKAAMSRLKPRL